MPIQVGVSPPPVIASITAEELAALIAERDALAGAATTRRCRPGTSNSATHRPPRILLLEHRAKVVVD